MDDEERREAELWKIAIRDAMLRTNKQRRRRKRKPVEQQDTKTED
jgi:hypothetical protein